MNELALFAGAGGGILGGRLLGWRTICAVERDRYAAAVLAARQDDGSLHPFPIWDDVCTFDGIPWRGRVDVISGGFPCQDVSIAGKGAGLSGERSGLWREFARIIREVEPCHVFVENSPALTNRGLDVVLGDLAAMGYDARWGVFGADEAALATHRGEIPLIHNRDRIWIVGYRSSADTDSRRKLQPARPESDIGRWAGDVDTGAVADVDRRRRRARGLPIGARTQQPVPRECGSGHARWWSAEPALVRMVHGVPYRMDRTRCLGNAQVPAVAALAWRVLTADLTPPAK